MKQNKNTIDLKQIMDDCKLIGESANEGKVLYSALVSHIESHPQYNVFYIILNATYFNASFAREGIVKVALNYRMKKGLCLVNVEDEDSLDNVLGPVAKLEQPIPYYINDVFHLVSHKKIGVPSKTNQPIFDYLLSRGLTTANEVAEEFQLKLSNASTKLKALFEEGFVLREEQKSTSGGLEYFYFAIK
jgi:hypothetical protein